MRRDHFTVAVSDSATGKPVLAIDYDGPRDLLTQQLTDETGSVFDPGTIDASFRLLDPLEEDGAEGVFSLTHRLTGEYLLEVNIDAVELLALIQAARDADDVEEDAGMETTDSAGTADSYGEVDGSYRVRIDPKDTDSIVFDLEALFVYDPDGELLRKRSLIPSGVQL